MLLVYIVISVLEVLHELTHELHELDEQTALGGASSSHELIHELWSSSFYPCIFVCVLNIINANDF